MSDILSAIHDDIEEYKWLCGHYKEEIQTKPDAYGNNLPDCYGKHARLLAKKYEEERHILRHLYSK